MPRATSKTTEEPKNKAFSKQMIAFILFPTLKEQCLNLSKLRKITKKKKRMQQITHKTKNFIVQ